MSEHNFDDEVVVDDELYHTYAEIHSLKRDLAAAQQMIAGLEAHLQRCVESLHRYGHHTAGCAVERHKGKVIFPDEPYTSDPCDCGLQAALDAQEHL